jgi:hypothetical protein
MMLGIHGVGYHRLTAATEEPKWRAALTLGLQAAGQDPELATRLRFVHYGDCFLPSDVRSGSDPPYDASDVEAGFEKQLLEDWYRDAELNDPNLPKPSDPTRPPHVPLSVQHILNRLSHSRTFAGIAEHALIFQLKQVRRYMSEKPLRALIQERILQALNPEIRVVLAHSLGTVVAYEALCASPNCTVECLITLGSPLGMRNLIFDRLVPSPVEGAGMWPPTLRWWVNVADQGDVVAIEKNLATCFGSQVEDFVVNNGFTEVHAAEKYLAQSVVGAAFARLAF